jgi:hypothetical protein
MNVQSRKREEEEEKEEIVSAGFPESLAERRRRLLRGDKFASRTTFRKIKRSAS